MDSSGVIASDVAAAVEGGSDTGRATEAQLKIYQTVPLHIDNLFPYTHAQAVHRVPSPTNTMGVTERRIHAARRGGGSSGIQLAAHLEGNIASSVYTLTSQPDTCVQWRLLSDRRTLELRPLRWVAGSDGDDNDVSENHADQFQNQQQVFDAMALEEAGGEASASVTSSWCFETPILSSSVIVFDHTDADGRLCVSVTVCAVDGVVYRLAFASVWEISSPATNVNACTSWYQIEWCRDTAASTKSGRAMPGRAPVLLDAVDAQLLSVCCEGSALVWLEWQGVPDEACGSLQGYVTEKVASSSGLLQSMRGFIPRLLRRGGGNGGDNSSSFNSEEGADGRRVISFAVTQVLDGSVRYAVSLSRDRKLRFWASNQTSHWQHEEQLPQLDVMGGVIPADPHGSSSGRPLLDPSIRRRIRIVSQGLGTPMGGTTMDEEVGHGSSGVFGVVVFVPDEATPYFALLQASVDARGQITGVQTVMYKVCKAANGASQLMADDELVDFQLSRHEELMTTLVEDADGQAVEATEVGAYWTLWALWERSQETVLTHTHFSLRANDDNYAPLIQFDGHPVLGERWYSVLSQQRELRPTNDGSQIKEIEARLARAKDEQNAGDERTVQIADISQAFLDHLFHPTRFDRGVLEHALALYETSARDRGFDFPAAAGSQATASSAYLRQCVAAVVGSFLRAETSSRDGSLLVGEYHRAVFTEWMRYSTLCARLQRMSNAPRALALSHATAMACVVTANGLLVVQPAGEIEWMHALARHDPAASVLLAAPTIAVAAQYPGVAHGTARAEVARLLVATSYVSETVGADVLSALANEMALDASGEILVSYETRAAELFERHAAASFTPRHMRHAARLLALCCAPGPTIRNVLDALAGSVDGVPDADMPRKSSAAMDGLLCSAFAVSAGARYALARDIAVLLAGVAYYGAEAADGVDIGPLAPLLARGFGVFGTFGVMQWIASQSVSASTASDASEEPLLSLSSMDEDSGADGFLRKFSVLNIDKRRDSAGSVASGVGMRTDAVRPGSGDRSGSGFVYSLLHGVIARCYPLRINERMDAFGDVLNEGVAQIYASVGVGAERGSDTRTGLVLFAAKMERTAPGELTESLLQLLPRTTAACYVGGLVALKLRDSVAAGDLFANAGVAYAQTVGGVRDGVDLQLVLPSRVLEAGHASAYYEHIVDLMETARSFAGVRRFGELALASLQDETETTDGDMTPELARDHRRRLWFRIFHAELELCSLERAYVATMSNPDATTQQDCLRHLVGVLCERSDGARELCRLSFTGLQEDVERTLLFKARHGDVTRAPNYYRILYAFHVFRGNYRNAASAMYQYARRLAAHMRTAGDVRRLLRDQTQALLACANALELVDPRYAWVVVGRLHAPDDPPLPTHVKRKRRRIAVGRFNDTESPVSASAAGGSAVQDIDIIELADIRREYLMCTARHTLGATFHELFARNLLLEADDLVALYVKTGNYDSAIALSAAFGLDLDYVFRSLTHKCLELSSVGGGLASVAVQHEHVPVAFWENAPVRSAVGTPSERAWRLLQRYLDREEPGEGDGDRLQARRSGCRYRLLVADVVLAADTDAELAPWLTSPLLRRCPHDLVRLCLRHGCVTEAAGFLLTHVNALTARLVSEPSSAAAASAPVAKTTRELWLPYKLVDQTVGALDDAVARFEDAVAKIKRAKKHAKKHAGGAGKGGEVARLKALRNSYRDRLDGLVRLHSDLQAAFDQYMECAARESRDISQLCDTS
ncbi:hypothetical protein IWW48_001512 [Coemansia sp. RSA 1200]|nr:hypothetical protein IWW48_001512 [Coemansia sp. RSA 1200]